MEVCSHNGFDPNTILLKINGTNCNLNCVYCSETKKEYKQSMCSKECDKIISLLPSSCDIILHGGEPLLDINNVNTAISAFRRKSNGHKLSIQTNGYIGQDIKQLLIENRDILRIGISTDGPREQNSLRRRYDNESVFDTVDETISFFEQHNVDIKCIATVNSISLSDPTGTLKYFISHKNIKQVRFNPCFDVSGGALATYSILPSQFLEYLLKITEYWIHNRVYKNVRIDPIQAEFEAAIRPVVKPHTNCCKFVSVYPGGQSTICDALGIKDFKPHSFSTIFEDAEGAFRDELQSPCMTCSEFLDCGGGCIAIFKRFKESKDLMQDYCNYRKKLKQYIKCIVTELM